MPWAIQINCEKDSVSKLEGQQLSEHKDSSIPCLKPSCFVVDGTHAYAVYDRTSKNVYRVNSIAAEILKLCDGTTLLKEIMAIIVSRFGVEFSRVEEDVHEFLNGDIKELISWFPHPKELTRIASPEQEDLGQIALKKVSWECTNKCNLKCLHCLVNAGKKKEGEFETDQAKTMLDSIAEMGVDEITFTGGEPTVRKDFFQLLDHAKECGMKINILTNGVFDQAVAKRLSGIASRVQISILGSSPKTHDLLTGTPGSFRKSISTINRLARESLESLQVSFVVMKTNFFDILNTRKMIEDIGVPLRVGLLLPIGRARKYIDRIGLTEEQHKLLKRVSASVSNDEYTEMESILQGHSSFRLFGKLPCPLNGLTITCLGDIILCPGLREHKITNVKNATPRQFKRAWQLTRRCRLGFSVENIEICSLCEFRYSCMGGCRAIAYSYTGNLFAKNPFCEIY